VVLAAFTKFTPRRASGPPLAVVAVALGAGVFVGGLRVAVRVADGVRVGDGSRVAVAVSVAVSVGVEVEPSIRTGVEVSPEPAGVDGSVVGGGTRVAAEKPGALQANAAITSKLRGIFRRGIVLHTAGKELPLGVSC